MRRVLVTLLASFVMLFSYYSFAWAKEPAMPELTLNDAVARALSINKELKIAKLEVDRAEDLREEAVDLVSFIPTGVGPYTPGVQEAYTNLLTKDLMWQMSKKNITAKEDSLALDVCNKYWEVQKAQNNLELKKIALASAQKDYWSALASHDAGIISSETLEQARTKLEKSKSELEQAHHDLDASYFQFNQLIGLWSEDRPVLVDKVELKPLVVHDLNAEVSRALEKSPVVWQKEQMIDIKKLTRYFAETWDIGQIEMEQAELDAANFKDLIEKVTRNLYYTIKAMEGSYPAALQAVKMAEETMKVIELKYEVGMATSADVAQAELALQETKKSLYDLVANHAYLKLAFKKPWAYISLSSSSVERNNDAQM